MGKAKAVLQSVVVACGLLMPAIAGKVPDSLWSRLVIGLNGLAWGVVCLAWVFFAVFVVRYWRVFDEERDII